MTSATMKNVQQPVVLKKKLIFLIKDAFHYLKVLAGRTTRLIDFPVPRYSGMSKTSSRSIRHYYTSSIQTSLPLVFACKLYDEHLDGRINVLDFGCGYGRQLLHFTRHFPAPNYHACDVDDTAVSYINTAYPQVTARKNDFHPPLPYDSDFFDIIYSLSIFSHLNIQDTATWIAELCRVTRRGGLCLISTEGLRASGSVSRSLGIEKERIDDVIAESGYFFQDYRHRESWKASEGLYRRSTPLIGIDGPYGNTVLSPDYIRQHWKDFGFEVLNIIEQVIDYRQDLVILRKN